MPRAEIKGHVYNIEQYPKPSMYKQRRWIYNNLITTRVKSSSCLNTLYRYSMCNFSQCISLIDSAAVD